MSDDETFDYDDDTDDNQPTPPAQENPNLAQLRKKAREADRLRVENETLRRERAFDKAKLPDDVPGINFFRENYKGDLSPEAILEAAATHGFVRASEPDTSTADRDAQQRMTAAAAGVSAPQTPDWQAGMRAAAEAAPRGQEAQAIADYMQSIGRPVSG